MAKSICEVCQILIRIIKEKDFFLFGRIAVRIKEKNIILKY